MHLISHLPLGGAKASLCRHSASAAASGSSKAGLIKGRFARLSHALLYRR
jgi:hypothetical protein